MKKLIIFLLILVLLVSSISAIGFATIGMTGLNFVNPTAATVVKGVLCVTSPVGVISCVEQYIEGKVIGFISGEVLQAINEVSPEAANAIITYNRIKGYIDKGANILKELKVNEKGEIEEGVVMFGEEEYEIGYFFVNLTLEDIKVSNAEYDFKTKTLIIDEGGFLKIKIKDEDGNIREFVYENIKEGGVIKLNSQGLIDEADFVSSKDDSVYIFGDNKPLRVTADTHIIYREGVIRVIGKDKNFIYDDLNIRLNKNFVDLFGNQISCVDCSVGEIYLKSVARGELAVLRIEENSYFLKSGIATSRGVELTSKYGINIFFDGERHEGDYVSFGEKNLIVAMEVDEDQIKSSIKTFFEEGNPYLQIDDGDFVNLNVWQSGEVEIENRDAEKLIPKLTGKGIFVLNENHYTFKLSPSDTSFGYYGSYKDPLLTTSPVEVYFTDLDDETTILGKPLKGHKLIIDNANRWSVIPESAIDIKSSFMDFYDGILFSPRLTYNYMTLEDVRKERKLGFASFTFYGDIPKGVKDRVLGRVLDYYERLTPETKDSILKIRIADDEHFETVFGGSEAHYAHAILNGQIMDIRASGRDVNYETFRHEAAHLLNFKINERTSATQVLDPVLRNNEEYMGLREKASGLYMRDLKKYLEYEQQMRELEETLPTLGERWLEFIQGGEKAYENLIRKVGFYTVWAEYGDLSVEEMERMAETEEGRQSLFGPRQSFIRPYGNTNILEDLATWVQPIATPEKYKSLLEQENPNYRLNLGKLSLLYEYNFISEEEYNAVLEAAGLNEE